MIILRPEKEPSNLHGSHKLETDRAWDFEAGQPRLLEITHAVYPDDEPAAELSPTETVLAAMAMGMEETTNFILFTPTGQLRTDESAGRHYKVLNYCLGNRAIDGLSLTKLESDATRARLSQIANEVAETFGLRNRHAKNEFQRELARQNALKRGKRKPATSATSKPVEITTPNLPRKDIA